MPKIMGMAIINNPLSRYVIVRISTARELYISLQMSAWRGK
jgi:hypothetical protein